MDGWLGFNGILSTQVAVLPRDFTSDSVRYMKLTLMTFLYQINSLNTYCEVPRGYIDSDTPGNVSTAKAELLQADTIQQHHQFTRIKLG